MVGDWDGATDGFEDGATDGIDKGVKDGATDGIDEGVEDGYTDGIEASSTVGCFVIKVVEGAEDTVEFSNSSILRRCPFCLIAFIPTASLKESSSSSILPLRNMGCISPLPLCVASVSPSISEAARLPPMREMNLNEAEEIFIVLFKYFSG